MTLRLAKAAAARALPGLILFGLAACGTDHKTDFGGGGMCNTGEQVVKDTANPVRPFDAGKPADTLRVATFNMSVGFPVSQLLFTNMTVDSIAYKTLDTLYTRYIHGRPSDRLKAMAKTIVDLDLDVVGLQEVETLAKNDSLDNDFLAELVADIKALNGPAYKKSFLMLNDTILDGALGGKTIKVRFSEGDAMLIKPEFEVLDSADLVYFDLFPLNESLRVKRAYNYARLRSPKGFYSQIYNTHLEVFSTYANSQASELARVAGCGRLPGHAQIVLGDFNAFPGEDAHRIMTEAGFYDTHSVLPDTAGPTCCIDDSRLWDPAAGFSARRIDFIFAKGITRVLEHKTALGAPDSTGLYPSDHRMVWTTLEVQ